MTNKQRQKVQQLASRLESLHKDLWQRVMNKNLMEDELNRELSGNVLPSLKSALEIAETIMRGSADDEA